MSHSELPESGKPEFVFRPFTSGHAALWVINTFFLLQLAFAIFVSLRPDQSSDLVSLGAINAVVFLSASALLLSKYPVGVEFSDSIRLAREPLGLGMLISLSLLAVAMGVTAHAPAGLLQELVTSRFPMPEAAEKAYLEALRPHGQVQTIFLMVVVLLLIPFAEETFFRGAVFGALRRSGQSALRAAIVTSLAFTVVHPEWRNWLPILAMAGWLGMARGLSGSLWPSLAFHFSFNAVTVLAAQYEIRTGHTLELKGRSEVIAFAVLGLSTLLFVVLTTFTRRGRLSRTLDGTMLVPLEVPADP